MYKLNKLCFANHVDELLRIRIPTCSLFLLDNQLCTYIADGGTYSFKAYTPGVQNMKKAHSVQSDRAAARVLDKCVLIDKRYYYYSDDDCLVAYQPRVLGRKYKWSLSYNDFIPYTIEGDIVIEDDNDYVLAGPAMFPRKLLEGIRKYYLDKGHHNKIKNHHYLNGKYYIAHDTIVYNNYKIGTVKDSLVSLFPKYSKVFKEDFS